MAVARTWRTGAAEDDGEVAENGVGGAPGGVLTSPVTDGTTVTAAPDGHGDAVAGPTGGAADVWAASFDDGAAEAGEGAGEAPRAEPGPPSHSTAPGAPDGTAQPAGDPVRQPATPWADEQQHGNGASTPAPSAGAPGLHPARPAATLGLLRSVVEGLAEAVTISTAVRAEAGDVVDMRLKFLNSTARQLQPDPEAAIGKLCSELWPGMVENGSFAKCIEVLRTGVSAHGSFNWIDPHLHLPAGYEYRALRVDEDTLLWVQSDQTEALRIRWALAESEERYHAVLSTLETGVILIGADRSVLAANKAAERTLGMAAADMPKDGALQWGAVDADNKPVVGQESPGAKALATGEPQRGRTLGIPRKGSGAMRWFSVNAYPVHREGAAAPHAVVVALVDVTDRRALESELRFLKQHDPVTELPNRSDLFHRIGEALQRAPHERGGFERVGLMLIDLDGFNMINDRLGHDAGDAVLHQMAQRLQNALREQDSISRLAGDQFVILLENLDPEDLEGFGRRLQRVVADTMTHRSPDGRTFELQLSASVGTAQAQPTDAPQDLVDRALQSMASRKRKGFSL